MNLRGEIVARAQERRFEAVGSAKTIETDVRVIAATNVNLAEAVKNGRFREDLFYRLNVIPITIPPLRERRGDIPLLIQHFISVFNDKKSTRIKASPEDAMDLLYMYNWAAIFVNWRTSSSVAVFKREGVIHSEDFPIISPPLASRHPPWPTRWIFPRRDRF